MASLATTEDFSHDEPPAAAPGAQLPAPSTAPLPPPPQVAARSQQQIIRGPWRSAIPSQNTPMQEDALASPEATKTFAEIPAFEALRARYDMRWEHEKMQFQNKLRENFEALTLRYASGRQEIFQLQLTSMTERYIRAFRSLFGDPSYQASVGDIESAPGGKKFQKLSIVLPSV